jgi:hypothetical protein
MKEPVFDTHTVLGVAGGAMCSILGNVQVQEVTHTSILAVIGTVISVGVSLLMKFFKKKIKGSGDDISVE